MAGVVEVLNSLSLSSEDMVTTWLPLTGENLQDESDLVCPRTSVTGDNNLLVELPAFLVSKM